MRWRLLAVVPAAGIALVAAVFVLGFVVFVTNLERREPKHVAAADAIVALTGGADRISDALDMLSSGKAKRLLITGVHVDVTRRDIARHAPVHPSVFDCCVDIDHAARNTVGNALETQRWTRRMGFRSLVVVTSNYHMPRTLLELRRKLPDVDLIAAPVVSEKLQQGRFWRDPQTLKLLMVEYSKFVFAYARASLTNGTALDDIVTASILRRS